MDIKRLGENELSDFRNLLEIFKIVFEHDKDIPDNHHLSRLLSNPGFMVFAVKLNGKVVGGLTIYILNTCYSLKPTAYIYDVGIEPDFQRKGLGKALIAAACNFCTANGFEEAYVEVESDDTDAVSFYRKTNYTNEMNATHFTYTFSG
jgi:aminoglycoside 3-N-acetyltransferase I